MHKNHQGMQIGYAWINSSEKLGNGKPLTYPYDWYDCNLELNLNLI